MLKRNVSVAVAAALALSLAACGFSPAASAASSEAVSSEAVSSEAASSEATAAPAAGDFDVDQDITVISREDGSGTRGAFIELTGVEAKNDAGEKVDNTTEEALLAVPDSYREGSFGLGAGKLRTVFTIVLPSAMPGILSGVILATGRIVGETAALIYTASTVAAVPASVFNSTRTLATHMYLLSNEGLHINETYGTAVVLLILVLLINSLSSFIAGRLAKK